MKPIIKWTGGKRRELSHLTSLLPGFNRYVEPFAGGAAMFFHLRHKHSIINDFDFRLVNFYRQCSDDSFSSQIEELKKLNNNHDEMSKKYYEFRDGVASQDMITDAVRFAYVNQLAFSGMRRFNSSGKFNVPFGHYKAFSLKINEEHKELLKSTTILNDCALKVIPNYDASHTFIFLDPPYTRKFKTYSADNDFDDASQQALFEVLDSLKNAKWMLVINDDDRILEMYKQYNVKKYSLKYGVNIKNRFATDVVHTIITNFDTPELLGKGI